MRRVWPAGMQPTFLCTQTPPDPADMQGPIQRAGLGQAFTLQAAEAGLRTMPQVATLSFRLGGVVCCCFNRAVERWAEGSLSIQISF